MLHVDMKQWTSQAQIFLQVINRDAVSVGCTFIMVGLNDDTDPVPLFLFEHSVNPGIKTSRSDMSKSLTYREKSRPDHYGEGMILVLVNMLTMLH